MKIAVVGNAASTMLNFRSSLLSSLNAQGHVVYAFCPDFSRESRDRVLAAGAAPVDYFLDRSGTNPFRELRTIRSLYSRLHDLKPDVLLCYFLKPSIYGMIAGKLARVPRRIALIEGLGYSFNADGASRAQMVVRRASGLLLRIGLRAADKILTLNDQDRDELLQLCDLAPSRIENVGGIGVELNKFLPAPVRKHATTFVMAARLIAEKGVREYLLAAKQLKDRYPASRFILLGTVDQNPHSLQAEELVPFVNRGVIDWLGHVDDVRPWLAEADVFVLPSYYREGVPRSIQEAMACARAIITTDNVGCRETVEPGRNGFLVPPRDVTALSTAMERFLTIPGLAQSMGAESRTLAEERYDAVRFERRLTEMLTNVGG